MNSSIDSEVADNASSTRSETLTRHGFAAVTPGLYQHYKGMQYRVFGTALHSETLEPLVVYEALYENKLGRLWVRPATMFAETVVIDGAVNPRFKRLSD